ncbi:8544_t:CDS:1, partial [Diversispora eburnea]
NNNSGYSDFSEDNNNNSDYSDLSEDDNNNNSDYSDLSEDDNNSDYSNLFEDDNNSDVEMDISEETNFKNITSLMMFTWITKHMIGNRAYKDLVNIINNENFNPIDVPKNIQTLKEQRKHLPLHKIRKNIVNINKEKTSSNSQPTKMAYSISIIDHIRTILNNSQIASRLYFGPGIETDKKSEFWHGTIWQESPLFGETSITVNK